MREIGAVLSLLPARIVLSQRGLLSVCKTSAPFLTLFFSHGYNLGILGFIWLVSGISGLPLPPQ